MSDNPFKIGDILVRTVGNLDHKWHVVGTFGEYVTVTAYPDNPKCCPIVRSWHRYRKVEPFFEVGKTYEYKFASGAGIRRFRVEAVGGEGDGRTAFGEFKDSLTTGSHWGVRGPEDFRYYDEVTE